MSEQTVQALWRYPVKSMGGESMDAVQFDRRGVVGDRGWAVITEAGKVASGKNTRRFERVDGLLGLAARGGDGSDPEVQLSTGLRLPVTDPTLPAALTEALGRPLSVAREADTSHFDAAPIHIVTTASLAWLRAQVPGVAIDARRLRPNVMVDNGDSLDRALAEEAWAGRTLTIGDVVLRVLRPCERCVMTTFAQGDLPAAPAVLERIARENAACLGVYADVVSVGTARVGDAVVIG